MKSVAIKFFSFTGMKWGIPFVKLFSGEAVLEQLKEIWGTIGVPLIAIVAFLFLWSISARQIQTSLGQVPGPAMVWEQTKALWGEHLAERAKAAEFYARQDARNAARLAKNPNAAVKSIDFTGKPTYVDQIFTSLKTVFMGIANCIAYRNYMRIKYHHDARAESHHSSI